MTWGGDELRFELEPDGDGTAMTFTATMQELGKASRDGAGWHVCLNNLAYELAGERAPESDPGTDWRQINSVYVERFGPEASTQGPPKEWEEAQARAGASDD
jgi:activator of Hsp90 ATPase-like protein